MAHENRSYEASKSSILITFSFDEEIEKMHPDLLQRLKKGPVVSLWLLLWLLLGILFGIYPATAQEGMITPQLLSLTNEKPTWDMQGTITNTITPSDDTYVWNLYPNDSFGSEETMWIYNNDQYDMYSVGLLKFQYKIPPNAVVTSANLSLKIQENSSASGLPSYAYLLDLTPWDEDTVTWNSLPKPLQGTSSITNTLLSYGPNSWDTWDVTELVKYAIDHQDSITKTISFGLNMAQNSDHSQEWFTKESGNSPELTITYKTVTDSGTIRGYAWDDANRNGRRENDEPGVPHVKLGLQKVNDGGGQQVETDQNGFFQFSEVPPGSYTLTIVPTAGILPTTENPVQIQVDAGSVINVNFGVYHLPHWLYHPFDLKP